MSTIRALIDLVVTFVGGLIHDIGDALFAPMEWPLWFRRLYLITFMVSVPLHIAAIVAFSVVVGCIAAAYFLCAAVADMWRR